MQRPRRLQAHGLLSRLGACAALLALAVAAPACEDPTSSAPAPASSSASAPAPTATPAERAAQCSALLTVVRRAADESKEITGTISGDGTKQLEQLAASASKAKIDVEKLDITDAKVDAARDRYAAMLGATATGASEVVAAARVQDFERLEKANTTLTKSVESEDALVQSIPEACSPLAQ